MALNYAVTIGEDQLIAARNHDCVLSTITLAAMPNIKRDAQHLPYLKTIGDLDDRPDRDCPLGLTTGVIQYSGDVLPNPESAFLRLGWFGRLVRDPQTFMILGKGVDGQRKWVPPIDNMRHPEYIDLILVLYVYNPSSYTPGCPYGWERKGNARTLKSSGKTHIIYRPDGVPHEVPLLSPLYTPTNVTFGTLWIGVVKNDTHCHISPQQEVIARHVLYMPTLCRLSGKGIPLFQTDDLHGLGTARASPPFFLDRKTTAGGINTFISEYDTNRRDITVLESGVGVSTLPIGQFLGIWCKCWKDGNHDWNHPPLNCLEFPTGFLTCKDGLENMRFEELVIDDDEAMWAINLVRNLPNHGKPDHSATLSTCGTITLPHMDYWSSVQVVFTMTPHLKMWFLWPANEHNLHIMAGYIVDARLKVGDGTFQWYINNLRDLTVRLTSPGDFFVMPPGTIHGVLGFKASAHVGLRLLSAKDWHHTRALAKSCLSFYRLALDEATPFEMGHTLSVPRITMSDLRTADNPFEMASYIGEWKTLVRTDQGMGDLKKGEVYAKIDCEIDDIFSDLADHFRAVSLCVDSFNPAEDVVIDSRLAFFKEYLRKNHAVLLNTVFPAKLKGKSKSR